MPDLLSDAPVTRAEQLRCIEREIAMRERVYPRWVAAGKMKPMMAEREIRVMRSVLATLQALSNV